jgi:uncharacterized SAM-binding protein YcdF (DUF218 family)
VRLTLSLRLVEVIDLYQKGWGEYLIFSGAVLDKTSPSNASVMRNMAISRGVPSDKILIDEQAETTDANAKEVAGLIAERDIDSIVLVTSGYHQRRAYLEFSRQLTDVEILNGPVAKDRDWSMWWWLTPRGWWLAGSETVKVSVLMVVGIWR